MSMMKLMLPPVVSRGQYQIMESRIAIVEHIAMTDKAMIGPQWHNLRTSWRFLKVTKVDRKFIFFSASLVLVFWLLDSRNFKCRCFSVFLCYLPKSRVEVMHIFFLVLGVSRNRPSLELLALSVSHDFLSWQRAASSLVNPWSTRSLWWTQVSHLNSAIWKKIPKENVQPSVWVLKLKPTWVMQQDNDMTHTCKSTSEWLKINQNNIFGVAKSNSGL